MQKENTRFGPLGHGDQHADFAFAYLAEAHAADEWQMPANLEDDAVVTQQTTLEAKNAGLVKFHNVTTVKDKKGNPVFLRDIWPTSDEVPAAGLGWPGDANTSGEILSMESGPVDGERGTDEHKQSDRAGGHYRAAGGFGTLAPAPPEAGRTCCQDAERRGERGRAGFGHEHDGPAQRDRDRQRGPPGAPEPRAA